MASTFKKLDRVQVNNPKHAQYLQVGTVTQVLGKLITIDFLIAGKNFQETIGESQLLKIGNMKDHWRKR